MTVASLLTLTYSSPTLDVAKGEELVTQGTPGRDLYVLESGKFVVERNGVAIATIEHADQMIGEMSVLLGRPHSATVRAERDSKVRVVKDAMRILEKHPELALRIAQLQSQRLDATSALLVDLNREHGDKPAEQNLIARIFSTLMTPGKDPGVH
jgi:CRP-like cAMP-binding protein